MQVKSNKYVGVHNDLFGGMTPTGKIIRDAWIFGIIPETETCENWLAGGIEDLWIKVNKEWEKYGFQVGNLPPDIRNNFYRIQDEAIVKAKKAGWTPDHELADEN